MSLWKWVTVILRGLSLVGTLPQISPLVQSGSSPHRLAPWQPDTLALQTFLSNQKKSQEQIRKPSMVFSLHGSVALSLCTASAYGSEGGLAITGAPPPQASTFSIVPCPNSESLSGRNNISGPRDLGLVFHFWVR